MADYLLLISVFLIFVIVWFVRIMNAKPIISIDYVAKFNELTIPENYNPDDNAHRFYLDAAQHFVPMPEELSNKITSRNFNWPEDMDPNTIAMLKEWLQSNEQALDYVTKAAQKSYDWVKLDLPEGTTFLSGFGAIMENYDYSTIKHLVRVLQWRARIFALDDKLKESFADIQTIDKVGAHFSGKTELIRQLVSIAVHAIGYFTALDILSDKEVDSKILSSYQQHLQQHTFVLNSQVERLFTYETLQHCFTDNGKGNGRLIPFETYRIMGYATNWQGKNKVKAILNKVYRYYQELACDDRKTTIEKIEKYYLMYNKLTKTTPWQLHSQDTTYKYEIEQMVSGNTFLDSISGTGDKLIELSQKLRADRAGLIATLAILRYKADNGQLPPSLEHLVESRYLKSLPDDPFGPGPLTYKIIDDDFILYTFGIDFDDDNGSHRRWYSKEEDSDRVYWPVQQPKRKLEKQK